MPVSLTIWIRLFSEFYCYHIISIMVKDVPFSLLTIEEVEPLIDVEWKRSLVQPRIITLTLLRSSQ